MWTSNQLNSIVIVAMKLFPCYLWLFSLFYHFPKLMLFWFFHENENKNQLCKLSHFHGTVTISESMLHPTKLNSIDLIISPAIHIRHINIIRQKQLTESRLKVTPTTCFVAVCFCVYSVLRWKKKSICTC